jgi:hypothetical protein
VSEEQQDSSPPAPPGIGRQIRLTPWQRFAVPVLLGIPILALLGVFGESWDTASQATSNLELRLEYPTRYRYKMLNSLNLDVSNTSAGPIDTITVALDTAYASRFSTVVGIPTFEFPYTLELTDLPPGETRRVTIELQGERYGRHSGDLLVTSTAADTARLPVSTFIFP